MLMKHSSLLLYLPETDSFTPLLITAQCLLETHFLDLRLTELVQLE